MTDPTRNEAIPRRFEDFVQQRLERLLRYATALTCDPHLAEDVVRKALPALGRGAGPPEEGSTEAAMTAAALDQPAGWRGGRMASWWAVSMV